MARPCHASRAPPTPHRCAVSDQASDTIAHQHGQPFRIKRNTTGAPPRSCQSARCTLAPTIKPSVSTAACRLQPVISLPAPKPRGPPLSFVSTRRLSMTPAEGLLPPFHFVRRHHQQVVDRTQKTPAPPVVEITLDHDEGGQSCGNRLHREPVAAMCRTTSAAPRRSIVRVRPKRRGPGIGGANKPRSQPIRSLEERPPRPAMIPASGLAQARRWLNPAHEPDGDASY